MHVRQLIRQRRSVMGGGVTALNRSAAGRGMRAIAAIRIVAFWDMVAKPGL